MAKKELGDLATALNSLGNSLIGCGCLLGFLVIVIALLIGLAH